MAEILELDQFDQSVQSGPYAGKIKLHKVGTTGTKIFGGDFDEEFLANLRGTQWADTIDEMIRSDGQINMLLTARKNPVLVANWDVEAAGSRPDQERHRDLIKYEFFERSSKPFHQLLEEIETFIDNGYSLFERIHEVVMDDPRFGSYIGFKNLAWRSQRTIESWNLRRDGSIVSVEQQADGDLDAYVNIDGKYVSIFTLNKRGDNYEGISALRPIFGAWFRKRVYQKLLSIGIERYAVGTPVGTLPPGKEQGPEKAKFDSILKRFISHEKGFITLPDGWKIEIPKTPFEADKIQKVIDAENTEMAKSFVANHLELGTGGNGGAYALGNDFSDIFLSIIQNDAAIVVRGLNQWARELIDLNFGKQMAYPKFKVTGVNDKLGKEFAEITKTLIDSKAITPTKKLEEFLRRQYKMPELTDEEKEQIEDIRKPAEPTLFNEVLLQEGKGFVIQSVILSKDRFKTKDAAIKWVGDHKFRHDKIDETDQSFRFRQREPSDFSTIRTIEITDGVKAVGGPIKTNLSEPEKKNFRLDLAELRQVKSDMNKILSESSKDLRALMKKELEAISNSYIERIQNQLSRANKSQWQKIARNAMIGGSEGYKRALAAFLSKAAQKTIDQTKKEVPRGTRIEFQEVSVAKSLKGLPPKTAESIRTEINLLAATQFGDLEKNINFQMATSIPSTGDPAIIAKDMREARNTYLAGPAVVAAAANTSAKTVNNARNEILFDTDAFEKVEAFQFQNTDPKSPICQDLNGTIFSKDDPEAQRFYPPLHHNCKSFLVPVFDLKGKKIDEIGLKPSRKELEKFITLDEYEKTGIITTVGSNS